MSPRARYSESEAPSRERRRAHRLEHACHWIGGLRRSLEHFDVAAVVSDNEVGEGSARVDGEAKSTAANLFGASLGRLRSRGRHSPGSSPN